MSQLCKRMRGSQVKFIGYSWRVYTPLWDRQLQEPLSWLLTIPSHASLIQYFSIHVQTVTCPSVSITAIFISACHQVPLLYMGEVRMCLQEDLPNSPMPLMGFETTTLGACVKGLIHSASTPMSWRHWALSFLYIKLIELGTIRIAMHDCPVIMHSPSEFYPLTFWSSDE